jgi:hypothetical protein
MLGDQAGEENGKITSQRVLDVDPPRMEISFSGTGEFRGVETTVIVIYWKGMVMSRDGQEIATFTGQGIGRFVGSGKIRFVGSVFYHTASAGKLEFLNNLVAVFEHEIDR